VAAGATVGEAPTAALSPAVRLMERTLLENSDLFADTCLAVAANGFGLEM
jgi:hypothetical protein